MVLAVVVGVGSNVSDGLVDKEEEFGLLPPLLLTDALPLFICLLMVTALVLTLE